MPTPMLAQSFMKHGHKIKFPCYTQPKLDGHRCLATIDNDGQVSLSSRTEKRIESPFLVSQIEKLNLRNIILDGELYDHDYSSLFEELTSLIKNGEATQYHIYDMVSPAPFSERIKILSSLFQPNQHIRLVETIFCNTEDDLLEAYYSFVIQNYEGAMARNAKAPYESKRSYNLQKIKEFTDSEFRIVGVQEGQGRMAGRAIFICETEDKNIFTCKLKGSLIELEKYMQNPSLAIGRMLTVQYQGITNCNQVPRFPVGIRFFDEI